MKQTFGMPTPVDVARSQGYIAFRTGRNCPYNHFTDRELVEAFYFGMARAEIDHAAQERA
jgi:hypothetical protein